MAKKKKPSTYFDFLVENRAANYRTFENYSKILAIAEILHPDAYKKATFYSDKVLDSMETNSTAFPLHYDLDFVLYWLKISAYANIVVDGLIDQVLEQKMNMK